MSENIMEMAFDQTNSTLEELNQLITKLEQLGNLDKVNSKLTLEDQAKLNAALSFCLNSLYWGTIHIYIDPLFISTSFIVYMRTNGIDIEEH